MDNHSAPLWVIYKPRRPFFVMDCDFSQGLHARLAAISCDSQDTPTIVVYLRKELHFRLSAPVLVMANENAPSPSGIAQNFYVAPDELIVPGGEYNIETNRSEVIRQFRINISIKQQPL